MTRTDARVGRPAGREWVRGGGTSRGSARTREAGSGFVLARELLLALCGRGMRRAMYLASVFACASSLAWSAALPERALADTDPSDTLHSPYVSAAEAREAGRVAREHPVPRPELLERQPAGEGPIYASGEGNSEPPLTFEDVNQPDAAPQEFAQVEQPGGGSSPDSPQ
ncbi:hypothetical protein GBA63_22710 (plasmid) [Rubrobacter tropicus]|uniref:Uncharacterized protein n=1 Tax=Rubrobacter tropicus TaxID=2653851 RepID=A0A6G8QGD3_9ACTN|nr:hypothetical protein [Rubrobacter tropicus]QIN85512.1 hypothetical protein GBA63_22710 [Rubrobacter tropicus]